MQRFLSTPAYNKAYIYKNPRTTYERFCNAFSYRQMILATDPTYPKQTLCDEASEVWKIIKKKSDEEISDIINEYFATPIPIQGLFRPLTSHSSNPSQNKIKIRPVQVSTAQSPPLPIIITEEKAPPNAAAQKKAIDNKKEIAKKLAEFQSIYQTTTDIELKNNIFQRIVTLKDQINAESSKIEKLKRNAGYQAKYAGKKARLLKENNEIVKYDSPGRPPILFTYPDLHEQMHDCIEFGQADARHSKTIAAKAHHHPAMVAIAGVARTEKNHHVDEHYCLASVKGSRQFAASFSQYSVIVSQDDKAKIPLGIPAVGRTFQTMQTINEAVTVADHDFPIGLHQKLIPSVYLVIDPQDTSNTLRQGQLGIYIRPQYDVGTSSNTHMSDLISLVSDATFADSFKVDGETKPIWILLVDGGPGQSAYNPVERSMSTLSEKLAGVTLPLNTFGNHLNSQGKVVDHILAKKNLRYAGKCLCDLFRRKNRIGGGRSLELDRRTYEFNGFLPPVTSYDFHCPSVSSEMYTRLCCTQCNKYFPTLTMVAIHKKLHRQQRQPRFRKNLLTNSIDDSCIVLIHPVDREKLDTKCTHFYKLLWNMFV